MWTFVSMFFNLDEFYIKNNIESYNHSSLYIKTFKNLAQLNINLVIYTDDNTKNLLLPYSNNNIKFIITNFNELELAEYIPEIYSIRKNNHIYHNSRNIPEWAIICMSKNEAIIKTIENNPFNTDIFCWIDFGFYREGHSYIDYSLDTLKDQLNLLQQANIYKENTIHMGLIDWVDKSRYNDLNNFYSTGGPCTLSGQFYFGNKLAFQQLKNISIKIFDEHIKNKQFHHDEQIYFYTLLKIPTLFTLFPTDYFCVPFDVIIPQKRTFIATNLLVPNLLNDNQIQITKNIVERLLISHSLKKLGLSDEILKQYEEILNS